MKTNTHNLNNSDDDLSLASSSGSPFDITSGDDTPIPENILQSYSFAETLYHSPKDHQDQVKQQSKYFSELDTCESLTPLQSILVGLELSL